MVAIAVSWDVATGSGRSSRVNLVILEGAHGFRSTLNTDLGEIREVASAQVLGPRAVPVHLK
jgi:hypothetical protein